MCVCYEICDLDQRLAMYGQLESTDCYVAFPAPCRVAAKSYPKSSHSRSHTPEANPTGQ